MKTNIDKDTYKLLVKKLKEYNYMQDEILDIETEICKFDVNSGYRAKNKINDNVAKVAIDLAENTKYQELKAWKSCIDKLLVLYINEPAKLKFLQRRYINCRLVNFKPKKKYVIKDKYVIADLELEGYNYSEITWKRWKHEMINKLYLLVSENKYIKKYINFSK